MRMNVDANITPQWQSDNAWAEGSALRLGYRVAVVAHRVIGFQAADLAGAVGLSHASSGNHNRAGDGNRQTTAAGN